MTQSDAHLTAVLEADRALREAEDHLLLENEPADVTRAIEREVERCFQREAPEDAGARLVRVADLLLNVPTAESARLLLKILGHEEPAVRVAAGEALVECLYDRYAEVARQIETSMDGMNNVALSELPFLLAEVGEPGGVKLVARLLSHPDPDVVGAAVEGLAAMGDPAVVRQLEPLRNDARKVSLDDDEEATTGEVTVGELAREAIEHLRKVRGS